MAAMKVARVPIVTRDMMETKASAPRSMWSVEKGWGKRICFFSSVLVTAAVFVAAAVLWTAAAFLADLLTAAVLLTDAVSLAVLLAAAGWVVSEDLASLV